MNKKIALKILKACFSILLLLFLSGMTGLMYTGLSSASEETVLKRSVSSRACPYNNNHNERIGISEKEIPKSITL